MKLKIKLPLIAVFPGLVIVSILLSTLFVLKQQKTDALVINLAGRQRMLSQKINKELVNILLLRSEGYSSAETEAELRWSMELFGRTLEGLQQGGEVPVSLSEDESEMWRCPVPSDDVGSVLDSTVQLWKQVSSRISSIVNKENPASGSEQIKMLEKDLSEVLVLSNRVTGLLQKESEGRSFVLLLIQIFGLVVGMLCVFWSIRVASRVLSKVSRINTLVEKFGDGNLTERAVVVHKSDELDDSMIRVNKLGESIAAIVSEIYAANSTLMKVSREFSDQFGNISSSAESVKLKSNTVAAAAEQASSSVNSISVSAEEMSVSVTGVANSMDQMSASINEVAKNCVDENRIASDADSQVRATHAVISHLGTKAMEIGRIVDMIADIADKTNLLALNAAIEAASAGDAGKGFAVVASEVKELAKQTANATEEIQSQIEGIQTDVSQSVEAVDIVSDLIEKVNRISQTIVAAVEEQSAASNEIARNVSEASNAAGVIARNVSETAAGITEVSSNIQSVNTETIGVADNIVASRRKVQELRSLSSDLQQVVSAFRISGKLIEWSPQFSIGIDEMDNQHKKLINIINGLNDALAEGKAKETVGTVLGELLDYTETHFTEEEAFMQRGNYSELEGHKKIHRFFTDKIRDLKKQHENGTAMISRDVLVFLKDWLVNHIAKMDKKYSAVLGKKKRH